MTKEEVIKFGKKVRAYYNYFVLDKDILEEWCRVLKDYDKEDIDKKFSEHLKTHSIDTPRLHTLIDGLETIEEKQKPKLDENYYVRCNLCGKEMSLERYDDHYAKCLLIGALISKAQEEYDKKISYNEFNKYTYEQLEQKYGKLFEPSERVKKTLTSGNSQELLGR